MASMTVCSVPLHRAHNERHPDARCAGRLGLIWARSLPPTGYRMAGGSGSSARCSASKNAGHLAAISLTRLAFKATVLAAARESEMALSRGAPRVANGTPGTKPLAPSVKARMAGSRSPDEPLLSRQNAEGDRRVNGASPNSGLIRDDYTYKHAEYAKPDASAGAHGPSQSGAARRHSIAHARSRLYSQHAGPSCPCRLRDGTARNQYCWRFEGSRSSACGLQPPGGML